MMKILILNGPNLNLLGRREPEIYGKSSFEDYLKDLKLCYKNIQIEYFQSNSEGKLIDKIHEIGFSYDGIVFNAGAYTHTSIALADALASVTTPTVEVHISNIAKREAFRHKSYIAPVCVGSIVGLGLYSYNLALEFFIRK